MINNRQNGRRRGRGGQRPQGGSSQGQRDNGNRIDSRARGNASQLYEKYKNMASDAQRQGDRVNTEYYLQFADHYFRVLADQRGRYDDQSQPRRQQNDFDGDDDYGDEGDPIRAEEQSRGGDDRGDRDNYRQQDGNRSDGGRADGNGSDGNRQQYDGNRQYESRPRNDRDDNRPQRAEREDSRQRAERDDSRPQSDRGETRQRAERDDNRPQADRSESRPQRADGDNNRQRDGQRDGQGGRQRYATPRTAEPRRDDRANAYANDDHAATAAEPAPVVAPQVEQAQPDGFAEAPAPKRRGRPRKTPVEGGEQLGLDTSVLPPSIGTAEAPAGDEAPKPRRRRSIATPAEVTTAS